MLIFVPLYSPGFMIKRQEKMKTIFKLVTLHRVFNNMIKKWRKGYWYFRM